MKPKKEGISRIVILMPRLGIVLKIARCNPLKAIKLILITLSLFPSDMGKSYVLSPAKAWWWRRTYYFKHGICGPIKFRCEHSFLYLLFRGVVANTSEFIFYLRNRNNPFLIPTYFSLFGIINIQPLQRDVCTSKDKVFQHLAKFTEFNELFKHGPHTFAEESNFCVNKDGKLCVLDYAGKGAQNMFLKYGQQFNSKFKRTD